MKTRVFGILFCSFLGVGCVSTDVSSKLNIVPGQGIVNVACLGMHAQEVAGRTRNGLLINVTGEAGSWAYVPTLGIHWRQETEEDSKEGLLGLKIIIDPSIYGRGCLLRDLRPFRGTLYGTLSMARDSDRTRQRLISVFGEPQHAFDLTNAGEEFQKREDGYFSAIEQGRSASLRMSPKLELLTYPAKGIEFWMNHDVLHEVRIMKKVEPRAAPLPPAPQTGPSEGAR